MDLFFLGTCNPEDLRKTSVPLFVSRRRLARIKRLPQPCGPWALDSGAFTELTKFGRWTITAMEYSTEVRRYSQEMGRMRFAAIQDWMCEPFVVKKTGQSVIEHQRRTVANYCLLNQLAPDLPWCPVIQGFTHTEYWDCVRQYENAGVDLRVCPVVGLGSVCRRQDTAMVEELIRELHDYRINLHGFGFKVRGIERSAKWLASADSMAWSFDARRGEPLPGCQHEKCANCLKYALKWREEKVLPAMRRGNKAGVPPSIFGNPRLVHPCRSR